MWRPINEIYSYCKKDQYIIALNNTPSETPYATVFRFYADENMWLSEIATDGSTEDLRNRFHCFIEKPEIEEAVFHPLDAIGKHVTLKNGYRGFLQSGNQHFIFGFIKKEISGNWVEHTWTLPQHDNPTDSDIIALWVE
jgi:hypothetical protein